MVVVQACKLNLPQIPSLSSPEVSSLLFDPDTLSLALMHSDTSFSLYPSLSPFSLTSPSLPPPQTLVPGPSSSATFLRLQTSKNPNSNPRLLFAVASPLRSGAAVLLRFLILSKDSQSFLRARVDCNHSGLTFDHGKSGVVFNVNHGVSIKLVGSINVFVMYSVSNCKIWVFAVKLVDDEDAGVTVKLMKCAVVDCSVPVFAISVSFGFLILGEENGVRVFPLRPLVKGRVKKHRREAKNSRNGSSNDKPKGQGMNHLNGGKRAGGDKLVEISSNGHLGGKTEKHSDSVKVKSVKLRQSSKEASACFVPFKNKEVCKSTQVPLQLAKAISIQALSRNEFLILDSAGDLQLLSLTSPFVVSEVTCHVKQLTNTMKAHKLVVLPEVSTGAQAVWISDGCHTVHALAVPEVDTTVHESDGLESDIKLKQTSVLQAIFSSERIQDIVPFAARSILILGQGSLFAYAIS